MKKSKLLMPIIGITTLSTIAMPLASCSCNKKEDTSTREVSIDVTLSGKVSCKTEVLSSGDYSVKLTCKDDTKYIPKIRNIIVGTYVLTNSDYSFDLKEQTIVIKKDVITNNSGWITILPEEPETIALESIKVTAPTKTEYNAGDKLDLTGMVVTAIYNNGQSEPVTEGYTTTPSTDDELKDTDTQVTVTYKEKTDKFNIKVNPVATDNFIKLTATAETTLTWTKGAEGSKLQYSTDGGKNWNNVESDIPFGNESTPSIQLKGSLVNDYDTYQINMIAIKSSQPTVALSGSLMNLLLKDDKPATELPEYAFANLFYNSTGLKTIDETDTKPILPCTSLKKYCYAAMFSNCTGLTNTPSLPAQSLEGADYCYNGMFGGCKSLTTVPALPATTLSEACYASMFYNCTSLTCAPELNANNLADGCYSDMFNGCKKLSITEDGPGEYKQKIFTCPDTSGFISDPVGGMFNNTRGPITTNPVKGKSYYCDTTPSGPQITLIVDPDKGSCNKTSVEIQGSSQKFGDAMYGVVVTPNSSDDYFEGWEDEDGNLIDDDTVISGSITATARIITREDPQRIDYVKYTPIYEKGKKVGYSAAWNDKATAPSSPVDIDIQKEIDGKPVTEIEEGSELTFSGGFLYNQNIKKVTIPANVEKIGQYSFALCANLTTVEIATGSKLSSIGMGAFINCSSLASINLPGTVIYIGHQCFTGANDNLFNDDANGTRYLKQDQNNTNNYFAVVPTEDRTKITTINGNCKIITHNTTFADSVTSLTIPASIVSICDGAINGSSITEVKFAANSQLKYLYGEAFNSGSSAALTSITLPNNEVEFMGNPFVGFKSNETTITLGTNPKYKTQVVGNGNLLIYDELEDGNIEIVSFLCSTEGSDTYQIPNNVEKIADYAFARTILSDIEVQADNKIISIGNYAFNNSNITKIDFTNWKNIVSIPVCCFDHCEEVEEITFPTNCWIKAVESNAFNYCGVANKKTSLTIPNSIDNIGYMAFAFNGSFMKYATFEKPEGSELGSGWNLFTYDQSSGQIVEETIAPTDLTNPELNAVMLSTTKSQYGRAKWVWTRIK